MEVELGQKFTLQLALLPDNEQELISEFITHVQNFGFTGLIGRNKASDNVPVTAQDRQNKINYAQTNALWHYHIGLDGYVLSTKGDYTSEHIIHYTQMTANCIRLVKIGKHPPFELPTPDYLT